MADEGLLLAIETGGTKIVCRLFRRDGGAVAEFQFPTTTPGAFIERVASGVADALPARARLSGIGVASFGPIDLNEGSATYGAILDSTKAAWRGFDLVRALEARLKASVVVDTDVNAAALAEQAIGAAKGLHAAAYVTVGTGIGAGLAVAGRSLRGGLHPELGHLRLRRVSGDAHPSACPFHDDCAEGLAAGPAIQARLSGRALADAPEVEALLVRYLGQLCATIVLAWAPQRIVLGGGVIAHDGLAPWIEAAMLEDLNGYGSARLAAQGGYVVRAKLRHAGLEGAALMASAPSAGDAA